MKKVLLLLMILGFSTKAFAANPQVILQTNYGDIIVELFPDDAPVTVSNFLGYVDSGFYDGVIFHRVINNFMIQAGLFDPDLVAKETGPTIVNEFGRSNVGGTLAMAKLGNDPDSATSQFFINQKDNSANLDGQNGGFTVFAEVIQGMDIVDIIAGVRTFDQLSPSAGWIGNVPSEPVIIEKAEIYDPATRVYVSTSGSDVSGNGTYFDPYATIQKAVDVVQEESHIVLFPGTYTGTGNRDIINAGFSERTPIRSKSPKDPATVADTVIDCQGSSQDMHRAFNLSNTGTYLSINGITITGGYHSDGGAIYADGTNLDIKNCVIENSTAVNNGGGVYLINGDPEESHFQDSMFSDNSAVNGGGIYASDSYLHLLTSRIVGNTASNGAGLYLEFTPAYFNNSIISYNNASVSGGGIYIESVNLSVNNCNIVYNSAAISGSALYDHNEASAYKDIKHAIIWGQSGPSLMVGDCNMTYSDVQGGYPGLGNINEDPLFVDAAAGDYHLRSYGWRWIPINIGTYPQPWGNDSQTSRCIDAGDPVVDDGKEIDIVRYDSLIPSPYGLNQRINMGAYGGTKEASMPPFDFAYMSDFNNDGVVNMTDLMLLTERWCSVFTMEEFSVLSKEWFGTTSWCDILAGDYNYDGIVDSGDLIHFTSRWISEYDMSDFSTISKGWQDTTSWYAGY